MLKYPRKGDRYLTLLGLSCPDFIYTIKGFNRKKGEAVGVVTCADGKCVCDLPLTVLAALRHSNYLMLSAREKAPFPLGRKEEIHYWIAALYQAESAMLRAYDRFVEKELPVDW